MKQTGYIDSNGKYHRKGNRLSDNDVTPTYREWHHDMERKQYSREIVQPRKNSRPNPEFIRSYPDISKEYFSKDEIMKGEREL